MQERLEMLGDLPELEERLAALDFLDEPSEKPDAKLMNSLEIHGQLLPILLREVSGGYDIVDGRRRVAALKALGKTHVRALIVDANAVATHAITIAANAVRSSNALGEYYAIVELLEEGLTEKEIAQATGMSIQTIRSRMKLSEVPTQILSALGVGKVAVSVAERIATLPDEAKERVVDVYEETGKVTYKTVAEQRDAVKQTATDELFADLPTTTRPNEWSEIVALMQQVIDKHDTLEHKSGSFAYKARRALARATQLAEAYAESL